MSALGTVRELAREALTVHMLTGKPDGFLWDRAQRLVRNAELICQLPELSKANLQIDHFALYAAAYFSDAGLTRHFEGKNTANKLTFADELNGKVVDFCTEVVEKKLAGIVEKAKIEEINRIITESGSNFTRMTEAMILSDARNLDDMGAVGIFNELKRYACTGKGGCDALKIWKRKIDYRYWQACLKKNFRFESVRKLAEQRLATAEYFMNQLKAETDGRDIKELAVELSKVK